ncbi:Conserved hypothetical protein CHP02464 [Penicillium chrysogenum]|uniref:Uncharacterized protein n=1 Tax=Penicillium chrysogenum TaxID=5076 RepID=A0ABQ8WS00_PENCH|nr:Conserved hypothetical protein CHP02464 [Penicillium chrysogenum]KAJ6156847.1 Conserved hypothetical protein CHP02464 [Penicillium chrysogenum]
MEEQTWKDSATYITTLRNVVIEYAGRNDKLTAVVCIGCQTNYTPVFTDIRGIEHYGSRKIWKFAFPLGGDLFIYITYHTCTEDPERVMDKNQVSQGYTEAYKNGQEMSDTSPESNPYLYLYHQHIAIWGQPRTWSRSCRVFLCI